MPRNIKLTWHAPRKCWKKFRLGRTFYLGQKQCHGKTDMEGYYAALEEWENIERALNNLPPAHANDPFALDVAAYTDYAGRKAKRLALAGAGAATVDAGDKTIRGLVDRYLNERRLEAEDGAISLKSYSDYRVHLYEFAEFCAAESLETADQITAAILDAYRAEQLDLSKPGSDDEGAISRVYALKRLARAKTWLDWLFEREHIDRLPRNIKRLASKKGMKLPEPAPKYFTVDECRSLFNASSNRTRLYIALGLNCGYTQKDIATLPREAINWKTGYVQRKRHKTTISQSHILWPITLKLLKSELAPEGSELALVSENGSPLLTEKVREDGAVAANDAIRLAFARVKAKLGLTDNRGFKVFRKTGANMIAAKYGDETIAGRYLAHSPGDGHKMLKHYTDEGHYEVHQEAVTWLGKHIGLGKAPVVPLPPKPKTARKTKRKTAASPKR